MILAGDIGGTKTNLALFDWKTERVEPAREQTFASADFGSVEEVLAGFLKPPVQESAASPGDESSSEPSVSPSTDEPTRIEAACFGVAGPVVENRSRTTNLPWVVDGAELAKRFELPTVRLLNDVEAAAHGVPVLRPDETEVLNAGAPSSAKSAMALIAAGGGGGGTSLFFGGGRGRPVAAEGGEPGLAPPPHAPRALLRCTPPGPTPRGYG